MVSLKNFDESKATEQKEFELLPAGDYKAVLAKVREDNRDGNEGIGCGFQVIDGEHKGRFIWETFFVRHSNEVRANIGNSRLKALWKACGKSECPADAEELQNIPVTVSIKHREYQGKVFANIKAITAIGTVNATIASPEAATFNKADYAEKIDPNDKGNNAVEGAPW